MFLNFKYNLQFEEYILKDLEYLSNNLVDNTFPKLIYFKGVTK